MKLLIIQCPHCGNVENITLKNIYTIICPSCGGEFDYYECNYDYYEVW